MDGSDFQKNKPQRCKIEIKNEVKTFYFGGQIRTWTVISKKRKVFTLFSNQRAARGFNSFFFKSGSSCEKFSYPWCNLHSSYVSAYLKPNKEVFIRSLFGRSVDNLSCIVGKLTYYLDVMT